MSNPSSHENMELAPVENVKDWVNSVYKSGVVGIVLLSAVYAFFPLDVVPDILPLLGQADDIGVLASGAGTITFMTFMRPIVIAIMKRPMMRTGCLVVVGISSVLLIGSAIFIFYSLYEFFTNL